MPSVTPAPTMVNATLQGFVTRKLACERFDISDRSLGRYLKKAMLRADEAFLANFKLATLDGHVIQGTQVTFEMIDRLQAEGRVPTWYVSSEWLQRKFQPRTDVAVPTETRQTETPEQIEGRGEAVPQDSKDEIIALLKGQVAGLLEDKRKLEEEKREMRIDARETRGLMNQMQQLMGHMQDRLLPAKATGPSQGGSEATTSHDVFDVNQKNEQQSAKQKANGARRSATPSPQSAARSKQKGTSQSHDSKRRTSKKPKWYETPTLNRLFSRH